MDNKTIQGKVFVLLLLSLLYACSDKGGVSPGPQYSVGGSVSGLAGVVTLNNASTGESIDVEGDSFSFAAQRDLSEYSVSVSAQPDGQICVLENAVGTVLGADVGNILLSCHSRWLGTQQFGAESWDSPKRMVTAKDGSTFFLGRSYIEQLDKLCSVVLKRGPGGEARWLWFDEQDLWAQGFHDAAIDDAGNVYVIGNYITAGLRKNFLIKLNSLGEQQWAKQLSSEFWVTVQGLMLGSDGDLYAAGYSYRDVEGEIPLGGTDLVVMRLSTSAQLVWAKRIGEANVVSRMTDGSGIAEMPDGSIVVSYARYSDWDWLPGYGYDKRLALAKFRADGSLLAGWPVYIPDSAYFSAALGELSLTAEHVPVMALDPQGDIYLSGAMLNGEINDYGYSGCGFVMKFSASDAALLRNQSTEEGRAWLDLNRDCLIPSDILVDAAGNAIVAGTSRDLDTGSSDIQVIKLDNEGQWLWSKSFGSPENDSVAGIGLAPSGQLLLGGLTYGSLDGNTLVGPSDLFLVKLDTLSGSVLAAEQESP